jgi:hypothetical protein
MEIPKKKKEKRREIKRRKSDSRIGIPESPPGLRMGAKI